MVEEQVDSNNYGAIRNSNTENEMERSPNLVTKMMITISKPIIINVLIFLSILLLFVTFQLWIQPTKRGFFCNDETIRYPFRPDTVTPSSLIICSVLPNILMIFYGESRNALNKKKSRNSKSRKYISLMFQYIGNFLWAVVLLCSFVNVIKVSAGRHRPFFLDVCKPNVLLNGTCTGYDYIYNYTCTGTNIGLIKESSLSFPSGHSAISFLAATFFVLYVHNRAIFMREYYLSTSAIQFIAILVAAFTAVSRIFDNHHHPEDVVAGMIIGIVFGYYFYHYNIFSENDKILNDETNNEDSGSEENEAQNSSLLRSNINV